MEMTEYIVLGVGVTFLMLLVKKYFTHLSEGFFEMEAQAVMKFVLFRSFDWFRFSFPGFYILLIIYILYEILSISSDVYTLSFAAGLLCFTCVFSYKLFRVLSADPNFFEFIKYSTSVKFYRELPEIERRQVYSVFMKRLSSLLLNSVGTGEFTDLFTTEYVPNISSIVSFERFDHWLENSHSRSYTGSLFCTKFKKSVDAELSDIRRMYESGEIESSHLSIVIAIMLRSDILDFDDMKGLHYRSDLLMQEIRKKMKLHSEETFVNIINDKLIDVENYIEGMKVQYVNNVPTTCEVDFDGQLIEKSDSQALIARLDEISDDLKYIRSLGATKEHMLVLDKSLNDSVSELKGGDLQEVLLEGLANIEKHIGSFERKISLKGLEDRLDDLVNAVYELSPKIIHMLPEGPTLGNITEFLINDLKHTRKLPLTTKNEKDIRKLVTDHFVVNGQEKYDGATGDYKDRLFFERYSENIYESFGLLSKKYTLPPIVLARIIKQDFSNYYPSIGRIQNKIGEMRKLRS